MATRMLFMFTKKIGEDSNFGSDFLEGVGEQPPTKKWMQKEVWNHFRV